MLRPALARLVVPWAALTAFLGFAFGASLFSEPTECFRYGQHKDHDEVAAPPDAAPHATRSGDNNETTPKSAFSSHDCKPYWGPEWALVWVSIVLVFGTVGLAVYTALLYRSTKKIAADSERASAKALAASTRATETLVNIERAYLTGGGDVENRGGGKCFRVDVANYGKTAAYLTHYEIRFAAKLADVQQGPRKVYEPHKQRAFDDRIAPDNKTKVIGYVPMEPPDAEIIYGCFWYTDWRKDEQYFRFILRVEQFTGRTRPDVKCVDDSYRKWT